MNIRGVVAGVLTLTFLQAVVSTPAAAGRVGGLFGAAAKAFGRIIDPSVPLIPDRRAGAASTSSTSSGGSGVAVLAPLKGTSTPAPTPRASSTPLPIVAPTPTRATAPAPVGKQPTDLGDFLTGLTK